MKIIIIIFLYLGGVMKNKWTWIIAAVVVIAIIYFIF